MILPSKPCLSMPISSDLPVWLVCRNHLEKIVFNCRNMFILLKSLINQAKPCEINFEYYSQYRCVGSVKAIGAKRGIGCSNSKFPAQSIRLDFAQI